MKKVVGTWLREHNKKSHSIRRLVLQRWSLRPLSISSYLKNSF